MNGLQALPQWKSYFGNPQGALLGLVNAAQSIGSVLVLPIVGWMSDRFGRRVVLFTGLIGVIIATIIQATSTTLAQFIVSRLVVGAAGMLVVQPAPMLVSYAMRAVKGHTTLSLARRLQPRWRLGQERYLRGATNL